MNATVADSRPRLARKLGGYVWPLWDRKVRPSSRGLRSAATALLVALLVGMGMSSVARADGDPGSDVLVYQDLFAGSDAGLSVHQQLELGGELKAAARKGFPIRVAIIASPFDLGAVTALWRKPRAYARFLGIELSAVYRQRLLVVMPDGLGFNWPGHATTVRLRAAGQSSDSRRRRWPV